MYCKEEITMLAEENGIEIKGLDEVPTIIQSRLLFDYANTDPILLKQFGIDPEALYSGSVPFNTAVYDDGNISPLRQVSDQYQVVQHDTAILRLMVSAMTKGVNILEIDIKTSPNGGKTITKFTTDKEITIKKGDKIKYQFLFGNSGDGTSNLWIQGGAWRTVCGNGMIIPDNRIETIKQKKLHKGSLSLDGEISIFLDTMEESVAAMESWKKYTKKKIASSTLEKVFEELHIGPRVQDEILELELRGEGTTVNQLVGDKKLKAWDLYNAMTQRLTDSESQEAVKKVQGDKISRYFDSFVNV